MLWFVWFILLLSTISHLWNSGCSSVRFRTSTTDMRTSRISCLCRSVWWCQFSALTYFICFISLCGFKSKYNIVLALQKFRSDLIFPSFFWPIRPLHLAKSVLAQKRTTVLNILAWFLKWFLCLLKWPLLKAVVIPNHATASSWILNTPRISVSSFSCLETSGSAHHRLMLTPFFHSVFLRTNLLQNWDTFSVYLRYVTNLHPKNSEFWFVFHNVLSF